MEKCLACGSDKTVEYDGKNSLIGCTSCGAVMKVVPMRDECEVVLTPVYLGAVPELLNV